jgi:hypothetical protein
MRVNAVLFILACPPRRDDTKHDAPDCENHRDGCPVQPTQSDPPYFSFKLRPGDERIIAKNQDCVGEVDAVLPK